MCLERSCLPCIDEPPWASAAWDTDRAKPVIADVSDIMLHPLGVLNVPTSVFQQGDNLNGGCIDLVRLNAHRV